MVSAVLPQAIGSKICIFNFCVYKHAQIWMINCWNRTDEKDPKSFGDVLTIRHKTNCQRSSLLELLYTYRENKVSLHFEKANFSRKILKTYSKTCIFVWYNILKVVGTHQMLEKSLKTVLDEIHFMVNLYCFPCLQSFKQTLSFSKKVICPHPRQNNFQSSHLL